MVRKEVHLYPPVLVILAMLLTAGCGTVGVLPASVPTPTPTPTPSPGAAQLQQGCPQEDALYSLWFSHLAVLDIDAGDGETIYLKYENIPPSFFDFWINKDGSISNNGIIREAPIGYHGTAQHPGSDDCPVQTFDGTVQMKATITGICQNNRVKIHIVEEWIDPTLNSDCGSASPLPGLYSAPELDLEFDLADEYPADFVQIPEGGPYHATYAYHLWPAGYDLPVVPLVPERE